MFDWKKPTFQMLIWEWSKELLDEFISYHSSVGQVVIMVKADENINLADFDVLTSQIITDLSQRGYEHTVDYIIMHIPNIVGNGGKKNNDSDQLDLFHG